MPQLHKHLTVAVTQKTYSHGLPYFKRRLLAYSFPDAKIEGAVIVVREALIDNGELSGNNLHEFWQSRAKYLGITEAEYNNSVVKEFEKIVDAPGDSEFNLWFEYDLFCQVNMWLLFQSSIVCRLRKSFYGLYFSFK